MIIWTITPHGGETPAAVGGADTRDLAVEQATAAAMDYFADHAHDAPGSIALTIVGNTESIASPGYDDNGTYEPHRTAAGTEHDDFFFTTNLDADVATEYACRWSIEDTFRAVKQHLGGQQPQSWKGAGPERAAALSFWIYTAIWCWYIPTHGHNPHWPTRPWYTAKRTPPASPTPSPNHEPPSGTNELGPCPTASSPPHKLCTPSSTRSPEPPDPPEKYENPPKSIVMQTFACNAGFSIT